MGVLSGPAACRDLLSLRNLRKQQQRLRCKWFRYRPGWWPLQSRFWLGSLRTVRRARQCGVRPDVRQRPDHVSSLPLRCRSRHRPVLGRTGAGNRVRQRQRLDRGGASALSGSGTGGVRVVRIGRTDRFVSPFAPLHACGQRCAAISKGLRFAVARGGASRASDVAAGNVFSRLRVRVIQVRAISLSWTADSHSYVGYVPVEETQTDR